MGNLRGSNLLLKEERGVWKETNGPVFNKENCDLTKRSHQTMRGGIERIKDENNFPATFEAAGRACSCDNASRRQ